MDQQQKRFFSEKGYLIIPGMLSSDEITFMRNRVLGIFKTNEWKKSPYNTDHILSNVYDYFPEFIDITLSKKVSDTVKDLLGDKPVLMPETSIHYKWYSGWHKDTSSQEQAGHQFHWKPESLMIEAGFYLQDNDEFGGGLTVMEGSQFTPDIFFNPRKKNIVRRIVDKLITIPEEKDSFINPFKHKIIDVPSKAGDLIIFDFKINHRATYPKKCKIEDIPAEKEKIAFFNAFSINNETAKSYIDYICSRPQPFYKSLNSRKLHDSLKHKAEQLGIVPF